MIIEKYSDVVDYGQPSLFKRDFFDKKSLKFLFLQG